MRLISRISVLAFGFLIVSACGQESTKLTLNERCIELMALELDKDRQDKSLQQSVIMSDFDAFHSAKLNTCIMTQINPITHSYQIRDLTKNFLKDVPTLFQCASELHYEADFAKVQKHNGWVSNVTYSDWTVTDDRSTAGKVKLSASECKSKFESMVQRIR